MSENYRQQVRGFRPEPGEWKILVKGIGIIALFAYFFYRSAIAFAALLPLLIPFTIKEKRDLAMKRSREIGIQFRDAILSVSTNQKAGYSVENAFGEAVNDMVLLYGKNSLIVKELSLVMKGLRNNVTLERLLTDLGERSGNPEVAEFAQVFAVAKRSGGNMTQMIGDTAEVIGERLSVENEIDVLLASKKMEAKIMEVVPFFIILYIGITSPGFFDPLYHNMTGILIMTGALALYLFAYLLSEKIIRVEV